MRFHEKHPEVWKLFVIFTHERIRKGFQNFGAKAIMERVRWETAAPFLSEDAYKINNNHTAFYARWFMATYPEHEGFFRLREQPSEYMAPRGELQEIILQDMAS